MIKKVIIIRIRERESANMMIPRGVIVDNYDYSPTQLVENYYQRHTKKQ
jgi:hypothetical protein